jgi:serine protease inhibitor
MDQLRGPVDRLGFSLYHAASQVVRATVGPGNEHRSFSLGVFSAASAAALIYVGSGGKTEANLHRVLHLEHLFEGRCTPELIMIAFRQALAHLTKRPDKHFPLDESILYSGFQVYMANKAFFRTGTHCKSEFRDNIKQHFHMDMDEFEPLGRSEDVELTRQEINEWVRLQTHGKIPVRVNSKLQILISIR